MRILSLLKPVLVTLALSCLSAPAQSAAAEGSSDRQDKIKTAMVYNFARFVSWRGARANGPIVLCVSPDAELFYSIMSLDGRMVEGRQIKATPLKAENMSTCHIAYLSETDARSDAATKLPQYGTLTISADPDFSKRGMISLVKIGRQNRFIVNNSLASESGVGLSSKLLRIAVEVH